MSAYKYLKIRPHKWWSIRAWKSAKQVERLDNWLLEHPEEFINWFLNGYSKFQSSNKKQPPQSSDLSTS